MFMIRRYYLYYVICRSITYAMFFFQVHVGVERAEHFVNQWVVKMQGGPGLAGQVAEDLGFQYRGIVSFKLRSRQHW